MTTPPYYILLSHSPFVARDHQHSNALTHPIIEYHYQDDSPLALLPQQQGEQVVVLDFDPATKSPNVRSVTSQVAVTNLVVEKAPGTPVHGTDGKGGQIYTIETALGIEPLSDSSQIDVQATLAKFKQRNVILRRALEQFPCPPEPLPKDNPQAGKDKSDFAY